MKKVSNLLAIRIKNIKFAQIYRTNQNIIYY